MSQTEFRPTTIYLVRHGESQLNLAKRVSGWLDTPLSPEGHRFSHALAEQLRDVRFTGVYTSALRRTVETARPTAVAHGLPLQSHADLNEQHFGVLEGRFRDARDPEARALWESRKQDKRFSLIPGGERFIDMAERVKKAVKDILAHEAGGTILIVGHRNTNRALFGLLMHQPEEQWPHMHLKSQCAYRMTSGSHPQLATISLGKTTTELPFDQLDHGHEEQTATEGM
jgi:broad specificity phosphatase PhoE